MLDMTTGKFNTTEDYKRLMSGWWFYQLTQSIQGEEGSVLFAGRDWRRCPSGFQISKLRGEGRISDAVLGASGLFVVAKEIRGDGCFCFMK